MSQTEDEAATVGFELDNVLRRYDRWRAAKEAWSVETDDDAKYDEMLLTEDALLLSAYRVVRYFAFDKTRAATELSPNSLAPAWTAPPETLRSLRQHLGRMRDECFLITGLARKERHFALVLKDLAEVADDFAWAIRAHDPEAARHFDHNLVELRKRLRG